MLQLKKFPYIPVSTREEARESRPHREEPRFRLLAREEGSFPCVFGKEFPAFPSYLNRRPSPQERREDLQGRATVNRVPQKSQSIPGKPVFPVLPQLSSRGSTHTTVARGTALWESLVVKPRGKATDPLIHAKGSVTLLLQLGRKAHVHAPLDTRTDSPGETPDLPQDPCQHWRGILRLRHQLHTRYWDPASTKRNPERPLSNSHGDWPFLRPPERVPEVPVISREHLLQLE